MSKTIKSMATNYHITAQAVIRNGKEMTISQFVFDSETRNAAILRKAAADAINHMYESKGLDWRTVPRDVVISEIEATRTVEVWQIKATTADIIAACKAAGLEVVYKGTTDATDAEETDEN